MLPPAHREDGDAALHTCAYCETIVIRRKGELKVAGRQHSGDDQVDWLHALCCRLCGASLPQTAAARAEKARCGYCGHRARLRPGLLSVLRVLFTDPKLLPPSLRRRAFFSLAIVVATVAMTAWMVVQESGPRLDRFVVDVDAAKVGDVVYDQVIDIPGFPKSLRVEAERRQSPGGLRLESLFVHQHSGSCFAPEARSQSTSYGASNGKFPGGKTRVFVQVAAKSADDDKRASADDDKHASADDDNHASAGEAAFYVTSHSKFSLGYLILALNIVLWLSIAAIKFGVDFQSTKRRGAQITQALSLLFLAYWFCMTVLSFDPFGPRTYDPNDAESYSKYGLACEALLHKGPTTPPNTQLIAAMNQAVALAEQKRAEAWQGISRVLSAAAPSLSQAPCVTNVNYALNKYHVGTLSLEDFQSARGDWMPKLSEDTLVAQKIAVWRGRLAADQSPEQSLRQAQAWTREVNIDDHAIVILDRPPVDAESPEELERTDKAPNRRRARLLVWSYKQSKLLCAAPQAWVPDAEQPDIEELLRQLRAVQIAPPAPPAP